MILHFLDFLSRRAIDYRVTNGYNMIFSELKNNSDHDIIFRKSDFRKIDLIMVDFCKQLNYKIVQIYHQSTYAKNYFIFDHNQNEILNLDLYGEIAMQQIKILDESEIFSLATDYKDISILRPHQEFIQYFIKKVIKEDISEPVFKHLKALFIKEQNECNLFLLQFFSKNQKSITKAFLADDLNYVINHIKSLKSDFKKSKKNAAAHPLKNSGRLLKRIFKPTGITIAFLGPDGSGKSTIIEGLLKQTLPFRREDYFHLKPLVQKSEQEHKVVSNPHKHKPYAPFKSYLKLILFILQYNLGWLKNIVPIKIRSSLVIFDRYYDDLLIDHKRYRYSGNKKFAKFIRNFIPRPTIYFILTADAAIINKRKQEVPFDELERQIKRYRELHDGRRYINIDVNRSPEKIVLEVTKILMQRMNERY